MSKAKISLINMFIIMMQLTISKAYSSEFKDEYLSDNTIYAVGKLEYNKYKLILAKHDGIIQDVHANSGKMIEQNQKLINLVPLDPSFSNQVEINRTDKKLYISRVFVNQGDFVRKNQLLMKLVSFEELSVNAQLYANNLSSVYINKPVTIYLDPDRTSFTVAGKIKAIHHMSDLSVAMYKIEVSVMLSSCNKNKQCRRLIQPGVIVKVLI